MTLLPFTPQAIYSISAFVCRSRAGNMSVRRICRTHGLVKKLLFRFHHVRKEKAGNREKEVDVLVFCKL